MLTAPALPERDVLEGFSPDCDIIEKWILFGCFEHYVKA